MPSSDTQFKPGFSGNPIGRPPRTRAFAAHIRQLTDEGKRLIQFHLDRMDGKFEDEEGRRGESAEWLRRNGWGPMPEANDIGLEDDHGKLAAVLKMDLSKPADE